MGLTFGDSESPLSGCVGHAKGCGCGRGMMWPGEHRVAKGDVLAEELLIVEFHEKEADEYAAWISISRDLAFAVEAAKRLQTRMEKQNAEPDSRPPEDGVELQALWVAALIAYCRCFTTGKRTRLKPSIFSGLDGAAVEAHEFFRQTLRDRHVAHRVNLYEQTKIGLPLEPPENADKKVIGIAELSFSRICEKGANLATFVRLAEHAKSHVDKTANRARDDLFKHARSLPVDELYERPHFTLTVKGPPVPASISEDQGTASMACVLHLYGQKQKDNLTVWVELERKGQDGARFPLRSQGGTYYLS